VCRVTLDKLLVECDAALAAGTGVVLVFPKGVTTRGMPRGELLCENRDGGRVYRYDALRLKAKIVAMMAPPSTRREP
jgi:hypothetical protein